jgi:hypothetical protein
MIKLIDKNFKLMHTEIIILNFQTRKTFIHSIFCVIIFCNLKIEKLSQHNQIFITTCMHAESTLSEEANTNLYY